MFAALPLVVCLLGSTEPPPRVLVMDVSGESLSAEEAGVLRDTITEAVARLGTHEVLSTEDVRRVLDLEAEKQALGCEGARECLAEIGAALGAQRVVYGTVAKLGATYVVSLSVVEPGDVKSVGRDRFEARSLEEVGQQLPSSVGRAFGVEASRPSGGGGFPIITTFGGVLTGAGLLATTGFGLATAYLVTVAQDPNARAADKQLALDQGENAVIATAVSGGVLVLGLGILGLGLWLE
jgi:hypothetical protein